MIIDPIGDLLQLGALGGILRHQLLALLVPVDLARLRHGSLSYS